MVAQVDQVLAEERERIRPYVEQLERLVRSYDPQARFRLLVGHVPEFWELDAYVRTELAEDDDLQEAIANEQTNLLVDDDAAIAVVLLPRHEEASTTFQRQSG